MSTLYPSPVSGVVPRARKAAWLTAAGCVLAAWPLCADPATYPLVKSCGEGASVIAKLDASVPLSIRYSYATGSGTCFAVTATVDGKPTEGYLLGDSHPAIAAFEHDVQQARVIPPPPPPQPPAPPQPAKSVAAEPPPPPKPAPVSFAGFRAVSVNGERVDLLGTQRAPNVVIFFWSATSRASIRSAEPIENLYDQFHSRGVDVVGIARASNSTQLLEVCRNNEFVWPQVLDSGSIAARYHVDPAKPFLLLDQKRNVIAAESSALALGPILEQLTKNRRSRL